jgi:type II secretory ATPase GspE/PulE/Tfp pilus assembly ATPase PilB-like protein
MEASPVEKLVYVLLLAAIKKKAERIDMRAGRDAFVVDFTIDGMRLEEMRPPAILREPVFDRLREMTGDAGRIHLVIGEDREVFFTVSIDAAGPVWRCELRPIASVD